MTENALANLNYVLLIDGVKHAIDFEIAQDDAVLVRALAPIFPGVQNAEIVRSEPKDGVITIEVRKRAGAHGNIIDVVIGELIDAPVSENPVIVKYRELSQVDPTRLDGDAYEAENEIIKDAIQKGSRQVKALKLIRWKMIAVAAQPSPFVPVGF